MQSIKTKTNKIYTRFLGSDDGPLIRLLILEYHCPLSSAEKRCNATVEAPKGLKQQTLALLCRSNQ